MTNDSIRGLMLYTLYIDCMFLLPCALFVLAVEWALK